jgi:hypothetical protein
VGEYVAAFLFKTQHICVGFFCFINVLQLLSS